MLIDKYFSRVDVVICPHLGQERADFDISYPQSGHFFSAIIYRFL